MYVTYIFQMMFRPFKTSVSTLYISVLFIPDLFNHLKPNGNYMYQLL
jgi:hypothetical protein